MLFVSKFAAYRHVISAGSMRWVRDVNGNERQVDNGDFFWAEFKQGGLTQHQQDLAIQEFRKVNPVAPFGAEPLMIDGTISMLDAAAEGETSNAHEAFHLFTRLSRFDTEDGRMCPSRWKEDCERVLLESDDFGRDLLRIDLAELALPWATYDEMNPDQIVAFATLGGFDIEQILRYEKANQKRESLAQELRKAQKRQHEEALERAALTSIG